LPSGQGGDPKVVHKKLGFSFRLIELSEKRFQPMDGFQWLVIRILEAYD